MQDARNQPCRVSLSSKQNEGTHLLRCHSAETASTKERNLGSVRLLFEKWRICIQSEWSYPIYRNVGITHCNTNWRLFTVTQLQHTFQVPRDCGTPSHREPPPKHVPYTLATRYPTHLPVFTAVGPHLCDRTSAQCPHTTDVCSSFSHPRCSATSPRTTVSGCTNTTLTFR